MSNVTRDASAFNRAFQYAWVTPEEAIRRSTVDGITVDCKNYKKYLEQQQAVAQAQAQAARALADYQNLVRRQQDDRQKLIRLATMDFLLTLLLNRWSI